MKTITVHLGRRYRLKKGRLECWSETRASRQERAAYVTAHLVDPAAEYSLCDDPNFAIEPARAWQETGGRIWEANKWWELKPGTLAVITREGYDDMVPGMSISAVDEGGIPGNQDINVRRYYGWRGTTDGWTVHALGVHRVLKLRQLKRGGVAVVFGPALHEYRD